MKIQPINTNNYYNKNTGTQAFKTAKSVTNPVNPSFGSLYTYKNTFNSIVSRPIKDGKTLVRSFNTLYAEAKGGGNWALRHHKVSNILKSEDSLINKLRGVKQLYEEGEIAEDQAVIKSFDGGTPMLYTDCGAVLFSNPSTYEQIAFYERDGKIHVTKPNEQMEFYDNEQLAMYKRVTDDGMAVTTEYFKRDGSPDSWRNFLGW